MVLINILIFIGDVVRVARYSFYSNWFVHANLLTRGNKSVFYAEIYGYLRFMHVKTARERAALVEYIACWIYSSVLLVYMCRYYMTSGNQTCINWLQTTKCLPGVTTCLDSADKVTRRVLCWNLLLQSTCTASLYARYSFLQNYLDYKY